MSKKNVVSVLIMVLGLLCLGLVIDYFTAHPVEVHVEESLQVERLKNNISIEDYLGGKYLRVDECTIRLDIDKVDNYKGEVFVNKDFNLVHLRCNDEYYLVHKNRKGYCNSLEVLSYTQRKNVIKKCFDWDYAKVDLKN